MRTDLTPFWSTRPHNVPSHCLMELCAGPHACFPITRPQWPRLWMVTSRDTDPAQHAEGSEKVAEDRRVRCQHRAVLYDVSL